MSQYTVPNVFHFVWFGSSISPCEATLKAWRELHPEATINLWLSTDATFNQESSFISELKKINPAFQTGMITPLQSATSLSLTNEKRLDEIRKISEQYKITVRYIEEETRLNANYLIIKENGLNARTSIIEVIRLDKDDLMMYKSSFDDSNPIIEWTGTVEKKGMTEETGLDARDLTIEELCLNNRDLIIQEVKNKRYWSASDIARFAILNKEPGFYFDIGIIPKQSLPNKVFCSSGFSLIFDTQAYIEDESVCIRYKLFCSTYPSHPFFTQILAIIHSIFTSLKIDPTPEEYFYSKFDNLIPFYPNLNSQEEASYLFARATTGTVAASVLSEHYIHNEKERLLTNNSNFSGFSFKYKSYLQIPLAKENHSNDVPALNPLRINSRLQNIFQLAQRVDHPLTDKLNTIYKLDTNEKEKFFCLQDQDTYLIAKLAKNKSSVRIKTTQSKIDGQSFQVGKNRYFIFQLDNSPEKINKIQTLVDELLTDNESLVSQKTIAKH